MRLKQALFAVLLSASLLSPVPAQDISIEGYADENFAITDIRLSPLVTGNNTLTAWIVNKTDRIKYAVIDIRTECLGVGNTNWQRQFFHRIESHEKTKVACPFMITTPVMGQMRLSLGESDRYFDRDQWELLPQEEQSQDPPPDPRFFWRKVIEGSGLPPIDPRGSGPESASRLLNTAGPPRLGELKTSLPKMIKASRISHSPLRERLKKLFLGGRDTPKSFDRKPGEWAYGSSKIEGNGRRFGIRTDIFTLAGNGGIRISAFVATSAVDADKEKPLILLLTGNPPGTKESMVNAALYFAKRGFHVAAMDRRESARTLDSKEKFLSNFTDPVSDALRLLDYLLTGSPYKISSVGLYGISAGAGEARFAAALDDRIDAVVLACGTTSFNRLFQNNGWIPTLSGMIIYPELGLGEPEVGKLSSAEFWAYFDKAKPEHNAKAKEIYEDLYPEFPDLDPQANAPLIAPVPCLIITGARDDQFSSAGVVEVDRAMERAYKELGVPECSELFIQPRTGHVVDLLAGDLTAAFFDRWLK